MKKKELKQKLNEANKIVFLQMDEIGKLNKIIDILEKQLEQQDKAIERKDKQFLGLRSAFQDEIINKL